MSRINNPKFTYAVKNGWNSYHTIIDTKELIAYAGILESSSKISKPTLNRVVKLSDEIYELYEDIREAWFSTIEGKYR